MDFTNNPQPNRPQPGQPAQPVRRPVFNDFGVRTHAQARPALSPVPKAATATQPAQPVATRPQSPAHPHTQPVPVSSVNLDDDIASTLPKAGSPERIEKDSKAPHPTAHSGVIGFVVFVVLCTLALAPFLPGKIMQDFPLSSGTDSSGEQSIGCATDLSPIQTSTAYNYKRGFPLVYGYETTSTIKATCNHVTKTATGGQTSQFNPLGGLIDVALAGVLALVVAKIWRKIFSPKR
jgi:hypothetical protein